MKIIKKALSIITAAGIVLLSCGCSVFGKITAAKRSVSSPALKTRSFQPFLTSAKSKPA